MAARPAFRLIRKILSWTAFGLVVVCATLYVLASWTPTSFRPPMLSQQQKEEATRAFVRDMATFQNLGQKAEPYTWTIKQINLNSYLASMDEIVYSQPGHGRGEVQKVLDTAGISPPMVHLGSGRMTIMLRSVEHGKVLSADLKVGMTDDGKVIAHLTGTRVGLLPVPKFAVLDRMAEFKATLQQRLERLRAAPKKSSGLFVTNFGPIEEMLATLVLAIDQEPLPSRVRLSGNHHVQIQALRVEEGKLILRIIPAEEDDD